MAPDAVSEGRGEKDRRIRAKRETLREPDVQRSEGVVAVHDGLGPAGRARREHDVCKAGGARRQGRPLVCPAPSTTSRRTRRAGRRPSRARRSRRLRGRRLPAAWCRGAPVKPGPARPSAGPRRRPFRDRCGSAGSRVWRRVAAMRRTRPGRRRCSAEEGSRRRRDRSRPLAALRRGVRPPATACRGRAAGRLCRRRRGGARGAGRAWRSGRTGAHPTTSPSHGTCVHVRRGRRRDPETLPACIASFPDLQDEARSSAAPAAGPDPPSARRHPRSPLP